MNVKECLSEGLLKKMPPDRDKAKRSLELAGHKLQIARRGFDAKIYENAIISAYTAMFHAARSLLYNDGFKERSHYALYVYVSERYGDRIERRYLHELNTLRMARHELMYGLEERPEVKEVEAESAISVAEGFLEAIRGLFRVL